VRTDAGNGLSLLEQQDAMKDRDGLKSTISLEHGQVGAQGDRGFWINLVRHTGGRFMAAGTGGGSRAG
jgi:hypothetical protein